MFHSVEVLGGVPVLGGIATSNVPACQTEPQVHPGVASLEAFFAALLIRTLDLDLIQMLAGFTHTVQCRKDFGAAAIRTRRFVEDGAARYNNSTLRACPCPSDRRLRFACL